VIATTGIGSLPFGDSAGAARHAVRAYDVPFCPQLPRLDGGMARECGWSAGRDRERPLAWEAFLASCEADRRTLVKLQVPGPVTIAAAFARGGMVRELAADASLWLAANAAGQVRALAVRGIDTLLLVDEPGLASAGLDDVHVWDPLRNTGAATWGLHICGPVPWPLVRAVRPGLLSFDAVRYEPDPATLATGIRIAWGVIDPAAPEDAKTVAARVRACLTAAGDPAATAHRSLLTPSCGTGHLSPARERLVAAVLGAAASTVRAELTASNQGVRPPRYRR
jgi:hypothetical protein